MKNFLLSPKFTKLTQSSVFIFLTQVSKSSLVALCFLMLLGFVSVLQAQSTFQEIYGVPNREEYGQDIVQTPDGNFVLLNMVNDTEVHNYQMQVMKTTPDGQVIWSHNYGTIHNDSPYAIALTPDNGFIIVGNINSIDASSLLIKLNDTGTEEWSVTLGGLAEASRRVFDLVINDDGSMVVVGSTQQGAFATKLNANGSMIWEYLADNSGDIYAQEARTIVKSPTGEYLVSGIGNYFDENGNYLIGNLYLKINDLGTELWRRAWGVAPPEENIFSLALAGVGTPDGGMIAAGYTGQNDNNAVAVQKIDSNGDLVWTQFMMNGDGQNIVYDMTALGSGEYVLTGNENGTVGALYYLIINENGDSLSTTYYQGGVNDGARAIVALENDNLAIIGSSRSLNGTSSDVLFLTANKAGEISHINHFGMAGQSHTEAGIALIQTSDGGYAIGGRTRSISPAATNQAWFIKTDAQGNITWQTGYSIGDSNDDCFAIAEMSNGYVLAGRSLISDQGIYQGFLMKIDLEGNVGWTLLLPSILEGTQGIMQNVVVDANNDIVVTGTKEGQLYLAKFDADGQIIWESYYGETLASGQHLSILSDGNYLVGGGIMLGSWENPYWIAKINQNGAIMWSNSATTDQFSQASVVSAVELAEGGYLLSIADKSPFIEIPQRGKYVVKLNNNGSIVWSSSEEANFGTYFAEVLQHESGNYYLIGTQNNQDTNTQLAQLTQVNNVGFVLNDWSFGAELSNDIDITSAILTNDGAIAMLGYIDYQNSTDAYLLKTDTEGNTSVLNTFDFSQDTYTSLNISPNPTTGIFVLDFKSDWTGAFNIQMVNLAGQVVYASSDFKHTQSYQEQINLQRFPTGLYLVKVSNGKETTSSKVVVE